MGGQSETFELADTRRTAYGWPRVLLLLIAASALVFVWLGIAGATSAFMNSHPVLGLVTTCAALIWVGMASGLLHNGRRMRRIAWASAIINLVMPIVALIVDSFPVDRWSPWYSGGASYWYVPTVAAFVSIIWLFYSSPARLAQHNG